MTPLPIRMSFIAVSQSRSGKVKRVKKVILEHKVQREQQAHKVILELKVQKVLLVHKVIKVQLDLL